MKNQTKKQEKRFFEKAFKNVIKLTDTEKLKLFYEKLKNKISQYEYSTPIPLNLSYHLIGELHFMLRTKKTAILKTCDYIDLFEEDYYNITIIPCNDGVEIERLEIYKTGKGIGSFFAKIFNSISIETNIPLYLIPGAPGNNLSYRNDLDDKRRRDFYHRHGFKRTKNSIYWQNTDTDKIDFTEINLGLGINDLP